MHEEMRCPLRVSLDPSLIVFCVCQRIKKKEIICTVLLLRHRHQGTKGESYSLENSESARPLWTKYATRIPNASTVVELLS